MEMQSTAKRRRKQAIHVVSKARMAAKGRSLGFSSK